MDETEIWIWFLVSGLADKFGYNLFKQTVIVYLIINSLKLLF